MTASNDPIPTRWRLRAQPSENAGALSRQLGVHPLVARLLASRGHGDVEAAARFLDPQLKHLYDPFELKDMDRAVARVVRALVEGERVTVYGDYDVDGVTSTTSLVTFLRACGADVHAYIPKRLTEGYGLNVDAVETIAGEGTGLIITCDCGVTAVDQVQRAVDLGVDVVIIDHHRVPADLPQAAAILNPYQPGCEFPFQHLAAVGVTFNLLMALRKVLREQGWFTAQRPEPNLREYLDLVALGTVADVVPLVDENRVFVTHGLKVLEEGRRVGCEALKAVSSIEPGPVDAGQIGFRLGPRINAAGRLDDARAGLELLLTDDPEQARALAEQLDRANTERRDIEHKILEEALTQAQEKVDGSRGLVLAGDGWHRGVVGIVASRIVERFHRPTLVLAIDGERVRGSGRSVDAFHLHAALEACEAHLDRFGGHKAAAGLEVPLGKLPAFTQDFLAVCDSQLTDADLIGRVDVDAEVLPAELDWQLAEDLNQLAPFGMGNPRPVLVCRGARLDGARLVGKPKPGKAGHLKARLGPIDVIAFDQGEHLEAADSGPMDLAFTLGIDTWQGRSKLQLVVKDLRQATENEQLLPGEVVERQWGHVHV